MLPAAAICASISQTSNSPFHTLCFQKVVMRTPPRKLKIHLMISLFDCCSSFGHCRACSSTCAIGDTWQSVWAKVGYGVTHNYPAAAVVAVRTPAQPRTYSTGCTRTLCLLGVAGNDRNNLETEIRQNSGKGSCSKVGAGRGKWRPEDVTVYLLPPPKYQCAYSEPN